MSFPVMLLVERANNDLLIFALLVAVAATLAWHHRPGPGIAAALLLLAVALKLYPIAGVHALFIRLQGWRKQLLALAVVVAAAGYAFAIRQDLALIGTSTPRPMLLGYGLNVLIKQVLDDVFGLFRTPAPAWFELGIRGIVLIVLAGLGVALARRLPRSRMDFGTVRGTFVGLLFSVGASVYVVTFLLGNNWDYRLTFLLLVVPQLFVWSESPRLLTEARIVLAAILASLWLADAGNYPLFQVDQLFLYALFVYFASVLAIVTLDHADVAALPQVVRAWRMRPS